MTTYDGKKMIVDTEKYDGGVYFHKDHFEFIPRRFKEATIKIEYTDIEKVDYRHGIKSVVRVYLKDGKHHDFYMHKLATFLEILKSAIEDHKVIDLTKKEPIKEISKEDIEKLEKLLELHKAGVLSNEEYQSQKDIIMKRYK